MPPQVDFKEIGRMLNPNGVAVIGGPNTTARQLSSQAAQAGIADCSVVRPSGAQIPGALFRNAPCMESGICR
jgi:hypothetical protein